MRATRASAFLRANLLVGASLGALLIAAPASAKTADQPATPPTDTAGTPAAQVQAQTTADADR